MALTNEQREKVDKYIELYDSSLIYNDNIDFLINESADGLSESFFGKFYCKAVALSTLHEFCLSQRAADGQAGQGVVVKKTIGPVSVQFSETGGKGSLLSTTMYGHMLLDLIKSCGGPSISVNHAWRLC